MDLTYKVMAFENGAWVVKSKHNKRSRATGVADRMQARLPGLPIKVEFDGRQVYNPIQKAAFSA